MKPSKMDSFRLQLEQEAQAIRLLLPNKIEELNAELAKRCPSTLASEVQQLYAGLFSEKGIMNEQVHDFLSFVRQELVTAVECHHKLERWIQLNIPKIEDGNNFGVEVQRAVLVQISQSKTALQQSFDQLGDYHWQRAIAYDKFSIKLTSESSTQRSEEKIQQGKDIDSIKNTILQTSSDKSVAGVSLADFKAYVVSLDVKWHFNLATILRSVQDHYAYSYDVIEKNYQKVSAPRGHGFESMQIGLY